MVGKEGANVGASIQGKGWRLQRLMGMGVKHYFRDGKEHKGQMHKTGGRLFSGKTGSKSSKRLYHYGDLSKSAKVNARKTWR